MILLDTNVLLYAIGGPHHLREPCRAIVEAAGRAEISVAIAEPTFAEFVHATARRQSRAAAVTRTSDLLDIVSDVIPPDPDLRAGALRLYQDLERLSINDALIAATSILFHAPLVSADRAFDGVPGLRVMPPESPEVFDPSSA